MERIKQAIERARAEQSESTRNPAPHLQEVTEAFPLLREAPPGVSTPSVAQGPVAVHYARTPVVHLDDGHLERHRVVAHQKSHPASWSFDVLRTKVLQEMDERGWRTLAVTSPSVESGKTVVAINLALSIANQTDRTALLVDFDLRRPSVAKTLGLNQARSLNDVLEADADVGDAMVNPGVERLVVVPTNRPLARASEVLSSAKVAALISELRERYSDRIVIFDLPPVLAADDVMAVLPRIDCVLMVVGNGVSTQGEIEEANSRLSKANLLGVVLNKDEGPQRHAYY